MRYCFIDPYVGSMEIKAYNEFVDLMGEQVQYFPVKDFPLTDLEKLAEKIDAYIVVGSASHVTEPLFWHRPLFDFIMGELSKNKPVLGCCFTHQLMASYLGGRVDYVNSNQDKIEGMRDVEIVCDWGPYKTGERFNLVVSHQQVVKEIPADFIEIGKGMKLDIIAHKSLPLLLTQAHPEAASCKIEDGKKFIERFFHHFIIKLD